MKPGKKIVFAAVGLWLSVWMAEAGFAQQPGEFWLSVPRTIANYDKLANQAAVRPVVELNSCWLVLASREVLPGLKEAGVSFQTLSGWENQAAYLLKIHDDRQLGKISRLGYCRLLETGTALLVCRKATAPPRGMLSRRLRGAAIPWKKPLVISPVDPLSQPPCLCRKDPAISDMVRQVRKKNLETYIRELQNCQTRYYSTAGCRQAADYLFDFFSGLGLDTQVESFPVSGIDNRNVIATLAGGNDPNEIVIICGHYDSYSSDPLDLAPGADDNGSGTAAVMENARVLSRHSFDYSIRFICFAAEELGLLGSEHYARTAHERGEKILGVINLDMIAYCDLLPEDLDLITNAESRWLVDRMAALTGIYTNLETSIFQTDYWSYSDHAPFWDYGYPALCGIEDERPPNPHYHTTHDTLDTLNLDFCTEVTRAGLACVADLAQVSGGPPTPQGLTIAKKIYRSLYSCYKTTLLQWQKPSGDIQGYNIYASYQSRCNYLKLNAALITDSHFLREREPCRVQYYVVTAVNNLNQESNYSLEVHDAPEN